MIKIAETYLEPSQTSNMERFLRKEQSVFICLILSQKSSIIYIRLGSWSASEKVDRKIVTLLIKWAGLKHKNQIEGIFKENLNLRIFSCCKKRDKTQASFFLFFFW